MAKVKQYIDDYSAAKNHQKPLEAKWLEYYSLYMAKVKGNKQGRSDLFIPYPFSTVEGELPVLVANRPKWEAVPKNAGSIRAAESMGKLIDYQYDRMRAFPRLVDTVKSALIYNKGIAKVYWRFDADFEYDEDEKKEIPKTIRYDDPVYEHVDLFDFFIDPNAISIGGAKYVIHRKWVDPEYIKQKWGKRIDTSTSENATKRDRLQVLGMNPPTEGEVELIEYWTDTEIVYIANDILLKKKANPFGIKPFFDYTPVPIPNDFWGVAEFQQCRSLFLELNDLRNQRMDFNTMTLNPPMMVNRVGNIDPEACKFRAGVTMYYDDVGGDPVSLLNTGQTPMTSFQEEQTIKNDIQTATAVNDYTRGASTKNQNTATGVMQEVAGSSARFDLKLRLFEQFLEDVGNFVKELNLRWMDRDRMLRITGPSKTTTQDAQNPLIPGVAQPPAAEDSNEDIFKTITPEEIQGDYDIKIIKGSTLPQSKAVQQQLAMNALNIFGQDPFLTPEGAVGLRQKVVKTFGWEDTDGWFAQPQMPQGIPGQGQPPESQPQPTSDGDIQRMMANLTGQEGGGLG